MRRVVGWGVRWGRQLVVLDGDDEVDYDVVGKNVLWSLLGYLSIHICFWLFLSSCGLWCRLGLLGSYSYGYCGRVWLLFLL